MSDEVPVVDQPTFDAIECNRCGECCEGFYQGNDQPDPDDEGRVGFWRHGGPLGWLELYCYYEAQGQTNIMYSPQDSMLFFGQLAPRFDEEEQRWRYSCGHFSRDDAGNGICGIYEIRPDMCSGFPYGRGVTGFPGCSWNVELLDFEVVESA